MAYLLFALGLAALITGGEVLVRGAADTARRLSMSPFVIGMLIVGFGTSLPELLVSVRAALSGAPEIALGNVIGSNVANVLLILGIPAFLAPVVRPFRELRRDLLSVLVSTALLWILLLDGELGRIDAVLLLSGLAVFLAGAIVRPDQAMVGEAPAMARSGWLAAGLVAAGLISLVIGARLFVDGATAIARELGISEAVIGLTVVAVGTSLPELATSIVAAVQRNSAIALGNVVGSNLFNILGILGVTGLIIPIAAAPRFLSADIPVALAATVVLALMLWWHGRIGRWGGGAMLSAYAGYTAWLVIT